MHGQPRELVVRPHAARLSMSASIAETVSVVKALGSIARICSRLLSNGLEQSPRMTSKWAVASSPSPVLTSNQCLSAPRPLAAMSTY